MASDPFKPSSASVSRTRTSRDEIRSLADEMLRASLTRSSVTPSTPSTPSSASSAAGTHVPSYHRSPAPPYTNPGVSRAPIAGAGLASISRDRIPRESISRSRESISRESISRESIKRDSITRDRNGASSGYSGLSAASAKARIRELHMEVARAKAEVPQRSTAGLFKEACSTDLLFLIDTTGSMWSYINAAKEQVKSIVKDIKEAFLNESQVRVAVVGYKDHADVPNVEFLDFTSSADQVRLFLDGVTASGGGDAPEDVLGGIRQALNASWKQQTRCIIHIADAPPHGRSLHDLGDTSDDYPTPGSEPHLLTHERLMKLVVNLNINYALLRINPTTDRMALAFSRVYAAASAEVKLLPTNKYHDHVGSSPSKDSSGLWSGVSSKHADIQFEELELGTTYSQIRHLVVRTVRTSVSRSAGRLSKALSRASTMDASGAKIKKWGADELTVIGEDEDSGRSSGRSSRKRGDVALETSSPQWSIPGWLNTTLVVEGFCPDMVVQSASTLNEMMDADENIKLSVAQLTIHARSKPFAKGALRAASYARTASSTSKFVVKSFLNEDGKRLADLAEDMRIQALCKAFALEFNSLTKTEPPIDFVVTTSLQNKSEVGSERGFISLEPYIPGEYVKYNGNNSYIAEDHDDPFNQTAQAFSHFTFERSYGHFLVDDLQGVGHLLTDPSIQTLNPERFTLADTNLFKEGFKFFFATHECNDICRKLELKSTKEMLMSGSFEFRESWPTMEPTVCCSNKLCRRIVRLANAQESDKFPGHRWCSACWPQLTSSIVKWICVAPGPNHEFDVSKFFYESQGQITPRRCPEHTEKDKTASSVAVLGGSLYSQMKTLDQKKSISGRIW